MKLFMFDIQGTLDKEEYLYGADNLSSAIEYFLNDFPEYSVFTVDRHKSFDGWLYTFKHNQNASTYSIIISEHEFTEGRID